jgi:hypothetical protein
MGSPPTLPVGPRGLVRTHRICAFGADMEGSTSAIRVDMHADTEIALALTVYGLALGLVFAAGYFGWRKIRPNCRRYGSDLYDHRVSERKKFWGYE